MGPRGRQTARGREPREGHRNPRGTDLPLTDAGEVRNLPIGGAARPLSLLEREL